MTRWTWTYQLIDDNGNVSSRLTADHDDERMEEVYARFREFLRGCGYTVPDIYDDEHVFAMLDDAMGLLHNHDLHTDPQWKRECEALCERYEEALK